jgi:hypothetical protein
VAEIALRNRRGHQVAVVVVDDVDAATFGHQRWSLSSYGYAVRYVAGRAVLLHREILRLPLVSDGREGDHRNRNALDCRRSNLRVVTHAQNLENKGSYRGSTSRHRGVWWDPERELWIGCVTVAGRKIRARFRSETDAAAFASGLRARLMPFSIEGAA